MTATSNPPAELPALGAGCEGDFSHPLVLPRPPRAAKNFTAPELHWEQYMSMPKAY